LFESEFTAYDLDLMFDLRQNGEVTGVLQVYYLEGYGSV
jgi:hypothetical protein